MAEYTTISEDRIPFTRGDMVIRYYDKLSVDFLVQQDIRVSVRSKKVNKDYMLSPLRRDVVLTLTSRNVLEL